MTLKESIIHKVNTRKCVLARALVQELQIEFSHLPIHQIRDTIMLVSESKEITEIELNYTNHTNESVLVPKGTRITS